MELPSGRSFSVYQSGEVLSAAPFVHAFYMMASWKSASLGTRMHEYGEIEVTRSRMLCIKKVARFL